MHVHTSGTAVHEASPNHSSGGAVYEAPSMAWGLRLLSGPMWPYPSKPLSCLLLPGLPRKRWHASWAHGGPGCPGISPDRAHVERLIRSVMLISVLGQVQGRGWYRPMSWHAWEAHPGIPFYCSLVTQKRTVRLPGTSAGPSRAVRLPLCGRSPLRRLTSACSAWACSAVKVGM